MNAIPSEALGEALHEFRKYRKMGERAMAQLDDEQLFRTIDPEANSIAIIVKHMHGNMRSRWTKFLTSDGEKPDRARDEEFEMDASATRADVERWWQEGWELVFGAVEALRPTDLGRTVTIRGEPHTVLQALQRQVTHYAYHVGQIVLLAKHFRGAEWESLSIPRGQSRQFNEKLRDGEAR
jgi:uncharacterized damage-inducible protein DinB